MAPVVDVIEKMNEQHEHPVDVGTDVSKTAARVKVHVAVAGLEEPVSDAHVTNTISGVPPT